MSTTLVSLEEYLRTSYSPDREYVDGVVEERNVGERPHSTIQSNLIFFLRLAHPHLIVWPEQRLQTTPTRCRIPDVCVLLDNPGVDVLEAPPFICIEILSPEDRMDRVLLKLEEYAVMGVPNIWFIDPLRRKSYSYRDGKLEEVKGELATESPRISIRLDEIFSGL